MPQYLRPTAHSYNDGFFVSGDPLSELHHEQIDEVAAEDADSIFVETSQGTMFPGVRQIHFPLSTGTATPSRRDLHKLRIRAWWNPYSPGDRSLDWTLRETVLGIDYTRASATLSLGADSEPTTFETVFDGSGIVDYDNLVLVIARGDAAAGAYVSWVELEVPLAPFAHLDQSNGGLIVAAAGSGNYLTTNGGGMLRAAGGETEGALILGDGGGHGIRL